MTRIFSLLFLIGSHLIVANNASSFNLILNLDGIDNNFQFIENTQANEKRHLPSTIILDDNGHATIQNTSDLTSIQTFHHQSDEDLFSFATAVNLADTDEKYIFAFVQVWNGSIYEISPSISLAQARTKRSLNEVYTVRSSNSVIQQAYVTIEWHYNRERRNVNVLEMITEESNTEETRYPASENPGTSTIPSVSMPDTMENITLSSAENDTELIINATMETTTLRPIPEKSRHLHLEIIAIVDSLITNDLRVLLNKTELETIEILKLYYINVFIVAEQLYRQSLIYETLDVHIRLSKIIFATDKHRLPWESFKNISTLTNAYRKSPNTVHLRPNVSMDLLKSLHHAYTSEKFDQRFFNNSADHIMTFTRLDLINGAGSAYVLGTCLPLFRYSIMQEDMNGFAMIITVAHELGHNLGLNHDETENKCNDPHFRYIMSPKNMDSVDRKQLPRFSECSINQMNDFVDNSTTTCWKNPIISTNNDTNFENLRTIVSTKLGQLIDVHQQCQLQYGPHAIPFISVSYTDANHSLYEENLCNQLRCFKTPDDGYMYWQDGAFEGLCT